MPLVAIMLQGCVGVVDAPGVYTQSAYAPPPAPIVTYVRPFVYRPPFYYAPAPVWRPVPRYYGYGYRRY